MSKLQTSVINNFYRAAAAQQLKVVSAVCVLLAVTLQVNCIPTSHLCPPTESLTLAHGSHLELECTSPCSDSGENRDSFEFLWLLRVAEGEGNAYHSTTNGPKLVVESISHRDSGMFLCKCLPDGPLCQFNVSVLPVMEFVASDIAVHKGDSIDLTCTVRGSPANSPTIRAKNGDKLPKLMINKMDDLTFKTYAPITFPVHEDYVCMMEGRDEYGRAVQTMEEKLTVVMYEPPYIIYTTEHIIPSKADLGKEGRLICAVQDVDDTTISFVSWLFNGDEISSESGKYQLQRGPTDEGVVKHTLVVKDLSESDVGAYLCRLNSQYSTEDMQEAKITVDYRRDTMNEQLKDRVTRSHSHSGAESKSQLIYLGVCLMGVVIIAMFFWKVTRGNRKTPLIGYLHQGNRKFD